MSAGHGRRLAARPAEGNPRLKLETAFSIDTSSIKYGAGVTREAGYEMRRMGARRVMVVTDPRLSASDPVSTVLASLKGEGVEAVLYDEVRVEPTDVSFKEAIVFAEQGAFDGYVAVGGGSAIDTAKAANLYATYPADFLIYVNAPIGEGRFAREKSWERLRRFWQMIKPVKA